MTAAPHAVLALLRSAASRHRHRRCLRKLKTAWPPACVLGPSRGVACAPNVLLQPSPSAEDRFLFEARLGSI